MVRFFFLCLKGFLYNVIYIICFKSLLFYEGVYCSGVNGGLR